MFVENTPAYALNKFMINQLNTERVLIKVTDKFPINLVFSENDFEFMKNAKFRITGSLAYSLELKIGAKFRLTCNIDVEDRLINGQINTVCNFMSNSSNRPVPIEQSQSTFTLKKKSKSSVAVTREHFPLTLSYACIVHRVKEISLSKAAVGLNLCKQKAFQPGQVYVAISCITNIRLYLTGSCNKTLIKMYVAAKDKYERNCINNLDDF